MLGSSMPGNMAATDLVGAGALLFPPRIGPEPWLASAVVETTVSDVFGFMVFLGIVSASVFTERAGQECPG